MEPAIIYFQFDKGLTTKFFSNSQSVIKLCRSCGNGLLLTYKVSNVRTDYELHTSGVNFLHKLHLNYFSTNAWNFVF